MRIQNPYGYYDGSFIESDFLVILSQTIVNADFTFEMDPVMIALNQCYQMNV